MDSISPITATTATAESDTMFVRYQQRLATELATRAANKVHTTDKNAATRPDRTTGDWNTPQTGWSNPDTRPGSVDLMM